MKAQIICWDNEIIGNKAVKHIKPASKYACSPMCEYLNLQEYCFLFEAEVAGYERAKECIKNVKVRSENEK